MGPRPRSVIALICLLFCLTWFGPARAQVAPATTGDRDREGHIALEDTVFSRARPEFETEGLLLEDVLWEPLKQMGAIPHDAEAPALLSSARAFANVLGETEYDDNVFRSRRGKRSDMIFRLKPSTDIHTDWDNGTLSLQLAGDFAHYASLTSEDYADLLSKLIGSIEFGAAGQLGADISLARRKEQRGSIEDPGELAAPTFVVLKEGGLRAGYGFPDSFFGQAETRLRQLTYSSEDVDRSGDDRLELELSARGGWRSGQGSTLFIEPKYLSSVYDRPTDGFGFQRDAKKYQFSGGVEWDVSPLTYIEAKGGYFMRDFAERRFDTVTGINYSAALTWNPSEFVTVKGEFRRDIEDIVLLNTSSAVITLYRLGLEYELRDNLLMHVDGSYETTVFNGLAREDTVSAYGAGFRYLINEYLFAGLRLSRVERESTLASVEYTDNRATAYLGFKLCCTGAAARQRGAP